MEPLKIVCAWCGVVVREGALPISHGACRTCGEKLLAKMEADDARA